MITLFILHKISYIVICFKMKYIHYARGLHKPNVFILNLN